MLVKAAFLICALQVIGWVGCSSMPGVVTTQSYNLSATLDADGNYILFWTFNATHVTFEVHVRTKGYVGFGISADNGKMFPADVVVGWVKDGVTYFKDRHTTGHMPPVIDQSQNWVLLAGLENDFGTVLKFARQIDTCDKDNDQIIQEGTNRLIYSYHPDDPVSEDALVYHGTHRGTKSASLLSEAFVPPQFPQDTRHFEFLNVNYIIPSNKTTYQCRGFQMPDLGGKHHMIKYEPVVTPGNELTVHHILLYRCFGIDARYNGVASECYGPERSKKLPYCSDVIMAWAIGGEPFYFPDHVGLSVGAPDDPPFYIMETHYDNPMQKAGVIDDSGIRITLTKSLRQHDVGMLEMGSTVNFKQIIPPHEKAFISKGYCAPDCITKSLSQQNLTEIRVIGALQHAHLLGRGIKTRHFRNGQEIEPLMTDPNYDFDFQEVRLLPKERVVKAGDSFSVECTYDSTGKTSPTLGGLSTNDEMCLTFAYYYPKLPLVGCVSEPTYSTMGVTGQQLFRTIMALDWTDPRVRQRFQEKLNSSTTHHTCYGSQMVPGYIVQTFLETEPANPFVPPTPQCAGRG